MKESARQARIVEWLEEEAGCIVIKQTTNRAYGRTGWPDLLALPRTSTHSDRFWVHFIETKTPEGKLSKMQRHRISQLRKQGYPVLVAQTVDEVRTAWRHDSESQWWGADG